MSEKTVLVTGATGMIGSCLIEALVNSGYAVIGIDKKNPVNEICKFYLTDLSNKSQLEKIYKDNRITHTIHLAALAHTAGVDDLSDEAYYQANVVNAKNVFEVAADTNILFISTVDVFGFASGIVDSNTKPNPVTIYGKTKAEAEKVLEKQGGRFNIYRFSPVYTEDIKRDIQKRYYLKYPNLAYIIGSGSKYEVLNVENAIRAMLDWVESGPMDGTIKIIKDKKMLDTSEIIKQEKEVGRAKLLIRVPHFLVNIGFAIIIKIFGENKYTYLLNKAVHPLRSR